MDGAEKPRMRVLIDQQFHLGHHYQYLNQLLPTLIPLVDEVVVAITEAGRGSQEFASFLAPFERTVRIESVLPYANPGVPMGERLRVHRDLRRIVRDLAPDYVLIPSGDAQVTAMPLFRVSGLGAVPGRIPCELGIHFGTGSVGPRLTDRLRDVLNRANLGATGAKRLHFVNHLFYERLRAAGRRDGMTLMPHPVAPNPRLSKAESRKRLNLPEGGRYIGLAASIDSRKAIGEFLAAFREASTSDERLVLAGWMNDTHQRMIRDNYADLLREGRLVHINGFLDPVVFQTVLSALDVVCLPYPAFAGLSSTLLEGTAAGRPVLVNAFGWSGTMVKRFGLGWACDVLNHREFARTMRTALDHADEYQESGAIRRLLAFHAPQNFASSWVQGLKEMLGRPADPVRSWEWVMESVEKPA